ncbi:unnamed protein product [Amaranthus hypochondriacus]
MAAFQWKTISIFIILSINSHLTISIYPPSPSPLSSDSINYLADSPSISPSSDFDIVLEPSSSSSSDSDSPGPAPSSDSEDQVVASADKNKEGSSGGHKAGTVIGVMFGASVVCFAGWIYKKRQDNIRRTNYGHINMTTII